MKIAFLCPYFGRLPLEQIKLWLKTCSFNPDFDWIIITDDRSCFALPHNVKKITMSFEQFRKYVIKKLGFSVSLSSAYKLCDFKPLYGFLFNNILREYDYWGHCDMTDCIFGDLSIYINEDTIKQYDKIFFLGHMTLYRNTEEVNKRFLIKTKSGISVKTILQSNENMAFDEVNQYSINTIYKENNFPLLRLDECYYDITPKSYAFKHSSWDENFSGHMNKRIPTIFLWRQGHLYEYSILDRAVKSKELGYIHYQKRKMVYDLNIENTDRFIITPKGFYDFKGQKINSKVIIDNSRDKLIYKQYVLLKFKALQQRIRTIKCKYNIV